MLIDVATFFGGRQRVELVLTVLVSATAQQAAPHHKYSTADRCKLTLYKKSFCAQMMSWR